MAEPLALIAGWARSAVAPHGGAFAALQAHEIGAPVLQALLQRVGLPTHAVDALVLGNALGAGGNPARMLALATGLPQHCATLSIDTQCCSGLDAVATAVGLLASGQASVVVAGGVEAWSRAPIRQYRPLAAGEAPRSYERPAFAPDPADDPDLLQAAADHAAQMGHSRSQQDAYALHSHQRAVHHAAEVAEEIVSVAGLQHDAYPRLLSAERAARLPVVARALAEMQVPLLSQSQSQSQSPGESCALSTLDVACKADGAALLLLATPQACARWGLRPHAAWLASATIGSNPRMPLSAAQAATETVLHRAGVSDARALQAIELHDAFATQGMAYCAALGLATSAINRRGGGLARGHPIGASGAMALVRLLADLHRDEQPGARGLAAIAGAGGIGAATLVQKL